MLDAFKTNGSSPPADIHLENYGSLFLLRPITDIAHDWVEGHLPEDATWWCGAVVVEHRFIGPIIGGAHRRRAGGAVMIIEVRARRAG
jgi:hypothetical protein